MKARARARLLLIGLACARNQTWVFDLGANT
jgi:hypothetical protein